MSRFTNARLVEFSFSSHLADDATPASVLRLVRQAWSDNVRAGVTGRMRLDGARLDQIVEGPSAVILELAGRILTDRRHGKITVRAFGPIAARRHADWRVQGLDTAAIPAGAPGGGLRLMTCADAPRPAVAPPTPLAVARAT